MNRRSFLTRLAAGAAAIALDPERALWVPGAKLISIPRPVRMPKLVDMSYQTIYAAYLRDIKRAEAEFRAQLKTDLTFTPEPHLISEALRCGWLQRNA